MRKIKGVFMNMKPAFFAAILFLAALGAGAEESPAWHRYPWSIGGGGELNQGSKSGWAQGYAVTLDRRLFDRRFALGLRASMDRDYHTISNFGGAAYFRLYPFTFGPGGAFAQVAFGMGAWQEDERRELTLVTDWSVGFQYCFLGGFYAEAYVRAGFPAQWAFGILAGHLFTF
jgi:hypothetical protein